MFLQTWDADITKRCKDFWNKTMSTKKSLALISEVIIIILPYYSLLW